MNWGIIATWKMAYNAVVHASGMLQDGRGADHVIETAIMMVEDSPEYNSVGYGGLPNESGEVELDAAFMDGDKLSIGAVGAIKDFKNPISIARRLSQERLNNFLVGAGAEKFASLYGFERRNMLTENSKKIWEKRIQEKNPEPYGGHDTIGVVCLDNKGKVTAATSTSDIFLKKPGRLGDSPLPGAGLYADSLMGGATATGLGEDIMKGCLCYEVVRQIGEGVHPQEAAERAVYDLSTRLKRIQGTVGEISLIAMDNQGRWGAGTNVDFSFVVATEEMGPTIYMAKPQSTATVYTELIK